MLKLLLNEKKKELKKEYLFRYLTILLFGLSGILILFLISLVPIYFILKIDQKVLKEELSVAQDAELNADRSRLKEKLTSLQQTLNIVDTPSVEVSGYIQKITERQPRDISILNISFDKNTDSQTIILQGNANSRGSLATFIDSLETIEEFSTVNLPFSSFTRDSDIPFSITISLVNENPDEK
jgi:multidrug efflux pump subunit AcrB